MLNPSLSVSVSLRLSLYIYINISLLNLLFFFFCLDISYQLFLLFSETIRSFYRKIFLMHFKSFLCTRENCFFDSFCCSAKKSLRDENFSVQFLFILVPSPIISSFYSLCVLCPEQKLGRRQSSSNSCNAMCCESGSSQGPLVSESLFIKLSPSLFYFLSLFGIFFLLFDKQKCSL